MWYNSFKRCSKWRIILKRTAFTLTEILISLSIIGVMMALSITVVKPREIQYKYQVQQAQTTLNATLPEAVLRTNYTDHRFPKQAYNNVTPLVQLCQGLNESLNTTKKTSEITNNSIKKVGSWSNVCTITMLNGMEIYLWAPGESGKAAPICRRHSVKNPQTNTTTSIPVTSYIAFIDIDGKGKYYSAEKKVEFNPKKFSPDLGNLPAFWIDEDLKARPMPDGAHLPEITLDTSLCGF